MLTGAGKGAPPAGPPKASGRREHRRRVPPETCRRAVVGRAHDACAGQGPGDVGAAHVAQVGIGVVHRGKPEATCSAPTRPCCAEGAGWALHTRYVPRFRCRRTLLRSARGTRALSGPLRPDRRYSQVEVAPLHGDVAHTHRAVTPRSCWPRARCWCRPGPTGLTVAAAPGFPSAAATPRRATPGGSASGVPGCAVRPGPSRS